MRTTNWRALTSGHYVAWTFLSIGSFLVTFVLFDTFLVILIELPVCVVGIQLDEEHTYINAMNWS